MIIRAYELKKRDLFIKQGTTYLVLRVTDTKIVYCAWNDNLISGGGVYGEIGRNSKERVEYIGVKSSKKITKPIKQVYESSL